MLTLRLIACEANLSPLHGRDHLHELTPASVSRRRAVPCRRCIFKAGKRCRRRLLDHPARTAPRSRLARCSTVERAERSRQRTVGQSQAAACGLYTVAPREPCRDILAEVQDPYYVG